MFDLLVNAEGGLTTAGYVVTISVGIVLFLAAVFFAGKRSKRQKMTTKQLVFCAAAMALAFVTSYVKIFQMPWGGSVTLCSMLFIVLVANWYGVGTGVLVGLAYGILQFIQEPYVLSFFQVCCDYILAFAALGVAGFFAKKKHGLLKGYIAAVLARGAFHALGGYLYWMDYMPDNFPKSLTAIYPIAYNYSFLLAEAAITLVIICIPAVAKGLGKVKQIAEQDVEQIELFIAHQFPDMISTIAVIVFMVIVMFSLNIWLALACTQLPHQESVLRHCLP